MSVAVDLLFGVALPAACLVFDPLVFKGFDGLGPLLAAYRRAAWTGLGLLIVLMAWWRIGRPYGMFVPGLLAGAFWIGGLVAFAFGIWLLPFLPHAFLFPLWGVLVLVPFPTGFVYLVNARRAYAVACDRHGTGARLVATLGAAGTVGLGALLLAVG